MNLLQYTFKYFLPDKIQVIYIYESMYIFSSTQLRLLLIAYKLRNFIRDVKHVVCTLKVIKNNLSLIAISQTKFFF